MSEREILISIIIPCYNVEFYINKCIESVLSQTFSSWEMICINDGSLDKTGEKIRSYVDKYPDKIKLIEQENGGAPKARNKGFQRAKGSFIQFLDADDWLLPNKLEHQYNLIHSQEKIIEIVMAAYINKGKQEKTIFPYEGDYWLALIKSRVGITSANLYHHNLIEKIGGWREDLKSGQDSDTHFSCFKTNPSFLCDLKPLTVRTFNRPGEMWEDLRFRPNGTMDVLHHHVRIKNYLEESGLFTALRKEAYENTINVILKNLFTNNLYSEHAQNLVKKSVKWTGISYQEKLERQIEKTFQSILEEPSSCTKKIFEIKKETISFIIPYLDSDQRKVRRIAIELLLKSKIYTLEQLSQLEKLFAQEQDVEIKKNIEKAMEESLVEFWAKEPPLEEMEKGKYLQAHLFLEKEAYDIRKILEDKEILFYEKVTQKGHPQLPNHHKFYAFFVPAHLYSQVIYLIQEYFGWKINDCPACQTNLNHVQDSKDCPECGIFLGQVKVNKHHPFAHLLNLLNIINLNED